MSLILEIERKFVVTEPEKAITGYTKKVPVIQGYFGDSEARTEIILHETIQNIEEFEDSLVKRVVMGVKKETDNHLIRLEEEHEFNIQFASEFLKSFSSYVIKTRYWTFIDGHKWDVDIYGGLLTGLAVAEVEHESDDVISNLMIPDYCSFEVSHLPQFRNSQLAKLSSLSELRCE